MRGNSGNPAYTVLVNVFLTAQLMAAPSLTEVIWEVIHPVMTALQQHQQLHILRAYWLKLRILLLIP